MVFGSTWALSVGLNASRILKEALTVRRLVLGTHGGMLRVHLDFFAGPWNAVPQQRMLFCLGGWRSVGDGFVSGQPRRAAAPSPPHLDCPSTQLGRMGSLSSLTPFRVSSSLCAASPHPAGVIGARVRLLEAFCSTSFKLAFVQLPFPSHASITTIANVAQRFQLGLCIMGMISS